MSKYGDPILPESYSLDNIKTIYYRIKPNIKKKYVYINDEDNTYIYDMLSRLIAEVGEKQFIEPQFFDQFMRKDEDFAVSSYNAGKRLPKFNSPFSYASGLVANRMRNPAEDFTTKQLPIIELLSKLIHLLYHQNLLELGYNIRTGLDNELPLQIKFQEC